MKIGLLSDAHGNHLGLETCLAFLRGRGVERVFFLGDAVGYLPDPRAVVGALMSDGIDCLLGNHDAMLLGALRIRDGEDAVYRIAECRKRLTAKTRGWLASLLPYRALAANRQRVLLVHGTPWDPLQGYAYPDSDLSGFRHLPYDYVFMGNTHRPFIKKRGPLTLVNVGSCGLPRDRGDLACCALFDSGSGACSIHRIPFDPAPLLRQYRGSIHRSVRACFARRGGARVYGTLVRDRRR